jgi:N-acetylneuraminate synthase/N,N'-diacetyllegionaminate synthase
MSLAPSFSIEGRRIGPGRPVFIIAEIGTNHDGKPGLARRMIDAAAAAGADCVKFQTFRAEEFMADRKLSYSYKVRGRTVRENMFAMFERLTLPAGSYPELFRHARKRGLVPLTSVADTESLAVVRRCGISSLKLASEDLINLPLVEAAARTRLPLLLSTGMADASEVQDALSVLARARASRAVFLHCVSTYPTPDEEANLRRMAGLSALVRGPVGYSDHTQGPEACLAAVALGACVIEKHFTLDRGMAGPDHALSAEPDEFKSMVEGIRRIERQLGSARVAPSKSELRGRLVFRRSIVAARDLPAGHRVRREDLALKRPGKGLKARDLPRVVGRRLLRAIAADRPVLLKALAG